MRRLRGLALERVSRVALLVLLALAVGDALASRGPGAGIAAAAVVAGMLVPLFFRRRAPLAVVLASCAVGFFGALFVDDLQDFSAPFAAVILCALIAGGIPRTRDAVAGYLAICALVSAVALQAEPVILGDFLFPMGFALGAWAAARAIRQRTLLAAELHEAALRAEEERQAAHLRAIADERRRIAREMHDLIGHSVSVMVVQAGGARRILDRDPARAAEAAALVEQTGRQALAEMRRLLGLMRPEDALLAPQPSLGDLPVLLERARATGIALASSVEGDPRPLPAGAEVAAYRVVQEALTNVLKHGGASTADVLVRWGEDALELRVTDDGSEAAAGADGPDLGGSGHGLVGMQERTRVYGGDVVAGPRPGGGFEVRARIPYEQPSVVAA